MSRLETTLQLKTYLPKLLREKGIDRGHIFQVQGKEWGMNIIPLEVVLEHIYNTTQKERKMIFATIVNIDYHNGSILDYFEHLAKAIAR